MPRYRVKPAILGVLAIVLVACSPAATASESAAMGTTVNVALGEFSVVPEPATAPAGEVTFHVTNNGPDDIHEFVVLKTDLAPESLPTGEDGSVDEEGEGIELIGEIEDIAVDDSQDLTETLDAGAYVLICNIVESGEVHYALGMRIPFTVE